MSEPVETPEFLLLRVPATHRQAFDRLVKAGMDRVEHQTDLTPELREVYDALKEGRWWVREGS